MASPVRAHPRSLLPSLVLGAVVVGAVALVGWLLLLFVKGTVVLVSYALGAALIALPLLLAHRLVAGHTGQERRQRIGAIAQAVGLGAALIVIAFFVGQHGWLLIAIPAAVVAILRVVRGISARRSRSATAAP
jgi:VIT1/CCC1 family predicted Fe2+/Mn2+ transporter